jgi:hypothetical protein
MRENEAQAIHNSLTTRLVGPRVRPTTITSSRHEDYFSDLLVFAT